MIGIGLNVNGSKTTVLESGEFGDVVQVEQAV